MKILVKLHLVGSLALGLTSLAFAEGVSGPDSYGSVGYVSMAEVVTKGPQTCGYETTDATFHTLLEYQKIVDQVKKQQAAKSHAKLVPINQKVDNLTHGYGSVGYTGLTRNWVEVPEYYVDNITFGYESTGYDAEQFKTLGSSC